jgi:hypothetical protein
LGVSVSGLGCRLAAQGGRVVWVLRCRLAAWDCGWVSLVCAAVWLHRGRVLCPGLPVGCRRGGWGSRSRACATVWLRGERESGTGLALSFGWAGGGGGTRSLVGAAVWLPW